MTIDDDDWADLFAHMRVITALMASGRLEDPKDEDAVSMALNDLLNDITDGKLPQIKNVGEPFPTVEEAVMGLLGAFADDVLRKVQ